MRSASILGIVLIVLGALALAYPTLSYTKEETVVDIGPLEVTAENREHVPLPPILGGTALAAGIAVIVLAKRRG